MFPNDDGNDTMNVPEQIQERFKVISKISSGGVGVVYEARDRILEKRVAIKMLHSISGQTEELVRFQREAKAASQLDHANIVKVFDFGMTDGAQPYMVMEYVDGVPLSRFLDKNGPLSFELCYAIFEQILDGLAHAHSHGVIHRDMKPANVMLRNAAATIPHVVLVDFGLAKIQNPDKGKMTHTGIVAGSPFYMSPEQAEAQPAGKESDIYAIGCMLFRALTGMLPFEGETVLDTLMMHINHEAPTLAGVNGKAHPEKLQQIVAKCLAKKPADRYRDAEQLKAALHDVLVEELSAREGLDAHDGSNEKAVAIAESGMVASFIRPMTLLIALTAAVLTIGLFVMSLQLQSVAPEKPLRTSFSTESAVAGSAGDTLMKKSPKASTLLSLANGITTRYPLDKIKVEKKGKNWSIEFSSNADELLKEAGEPTCRTLNTKGSALTDEGLKTIENWPIHSLDVSQTDITDAGLKSIAKMKDLKDLKMNTLSVLSSKGLNELRGMPNLKTLRMHESTFRDDIMPVLTSFSQIKELYLNDSIWLDTKNVMQFARMKQLKKLDLQYSSKIDIPTVDKLRPLMPGCFVRFTERVLLVPGVSNEDAHKQWDDLAPPSENKVERIQ